jgi:hypothetical protein
MFDAFGRLGDYLAEAEVVADVYIVGGAVMVTEYDARESTVDGAVFEPYGEVVRAAARVAESMGLPASWLNQNASAYVGRSPDWRRSSTFDHPNLHIYVPAPEQLLAMKVRAGRPTDAEDIATLCQIVDARSVDDVAAIVRAAFPDAEIPARGLALTRDVLAEPR